MSKSDNRFEELIAFFLKQQKEKEKMKQEWAKLGMQYNPFRIREEALKDDGNSNKPPASVVLNYKADMKDFLQDFEVQNLYLPVPQTPPTYSPVDFAQFDKNLGSSSMLWITAILVMILLIFTIRAAEKCFESRLMNESRRLADEWPPASVIATSQQAANNGEITLRVDMPMCPNNQDMPPPYSDCTNNVTLNPKYLEEPPPPYASCFVAYSAPKDGVPSVNINIQKASTSGSGVPTESTAGNQAGERENVNAVNNDNSNEEVV